MDSWFEKRLKSSLELDLPYAHRARMTLTHARAAVLVLFAPNQSGDHEILYIRRAEEIGPHSGQMAFPGGKAEECDLNDPIETALRETQEEVGILRDQVRILGRLPPIVTPTRFEIDPIVGVLSQSLEKIEFKLDPLEVAGTAWIPFSSLMDQKNYRQEVIKAGELMYPIDVFYVRSYRIWGATGSMTKNLIDRYRFQTK